MTTTPAPTRHPACNLPRDDGGHLVDLFRKSTPEDRAVGLAWYLNAHATARDLQAISGHGQPSAWTLAQAACVLAALSPRNRWGRNVEDAQALARWYASGPAGPVPRVGTFDHARDRALRVCRAPTAPYAALGRGLKTTSFARLIERPSLPYVVVVDSHAYRAYRGEPPGAARISHADYRQAAYGYFAATDWLQSTGELASHQTPACLQAVVWTTFRRLHGVGS